MFFCMGNKKAPPLGQGFRVLYLTVGERVAYICNRLNHGHILTLLNTSVSSISSHMDGSQFVRRHRPPIGLIRDVGGSEVLGLEPLDTDTASDTMAPVSMKQFKTLMKGSWVCFAPRFTSQHILKPKQERIYT